MRPWPLPFLAVCSVCVTALGQSPLKIHNHWIGQPAAEFVKEDSEVAQEMAYCKSLVANPDAAFSAIGIVPLSTSGSNRTTNIANAQINQATKEGVLSGLRSSHECDALDILVNHSGTVELTKESFTSHSSDQAHKALTKWQFVNGFLNEIILQLTGSSFDETVLDLTARIGSSPRELNTPMQNAFGAVWNDESANWLTSEVHVEVRQNNNPAERSLIVNVEKRSDFDRKIAEDKSKPSPLD